MQQFVDKHLARVGVAYRPSLVLNYLNTQIAMVEAGEGMSVLLMKCEIGQKARSVIGPSDFSTKLEQLPCGSANCHSGLGLSKFGNDA